MSDETQQVETAPESPAAPVEGTPEAKAAETPPEAAAKPTSEAWVKVRQAEERARRERDEAKALSKKTADERTELERLRAEVESQRAKLSLDAFGGDPAAFLDAHKIDYDDLTRRMLNRPVKRAGAPASKEIEELRTELAAIKKAREDEAAQRETQQHEHAWGRVVHAFEAEIAPPSEGDHAYELLHHEYAGDPDFVRQTLREMAQAAPELTVAQAAAKFEEFLLNQTKSRLGLKKIRALSGASPDAKPSSQPAQQATTGQPASEGGPRTLSHVDSSEHATDVAPTKPFHEMTLKERRDWEKESEARAAKALETLWGRSA